MSKEQIQTLENSEIKSEEPVESEVKEEIVEKEEKSDEPEESPTWMNSLIIARDVVQGAYPHITEGATHYHNDSVYPYWADSLNETVIINNHIFYK